MIPEDHITPIFNNSTRKSPYFSQIKDSKDIQRLKKKSYIDIYNRKTNYQDLGSSTTYVDILSISLLSFFSSICNKCKIYSLPEFPVVKAVVKKRWQARWRRGCFEDKRFTSRGENRKNKPIMIEVDSQNCRKLTW